MQTQSDQSEHIPQTQVTDSRAVQMYKQLLDLPFWSSLQTDFEAIQRDIKDSSISYHPEEEQSYCIRIVGHCLNFKVITLQVTLGFFTFNISMIDEPVLSRAHLIEKYVFRNSRYYMTSQQIPAFAIKCFPLQPQNRMKQLRSVIREYSFNRVAAALGVGPALLTPFGFDLIICAECIEFAIEQCLPIHRSPQFWKNDLQVQLKQKLKKMHSVGIVHSNIHPKNIIYKGETHEALFADYCCARLLPSLKVGQQVQSQPVGHFNYSSDELISVFNGDATEADLYINDAVALKRTLTQIEEQLNKAYRKTFNQLTWQINLGDLLEPEMTMYHNLSKTQPKPQEGYDFMYDYFDMLKLFKNIHINNLEALESASIKKQIAKNAKEVSIFIKGLDISEAKEKVNFILETIRNEQQQQYQISQAIYSPSASNFIEKMNCQHFLQNDEESVEIETNAINTISNKIVGCLNEGFQLPLQFKQDRRAIVLHKTVIKRIHKTTYYKQLVNFLDLRQLNSTFKQKIKACELFIKTQKGAQKATNQEVGPYQQIERCLKHILYFNLDKSTSTSSEIIIPTAIANLLIIDSISIHDLLDIMEKIPTMKMGSTQMCILLFKIYCAVDFVNFRAVSIEEHVGTVQQIRKHVRKTMLQLKGSLNATFINFIATALISEFSPLTIEEDKIGEAFAEIRRFTKEEVIDKETANQLAAMISFNTIFSSFFSLEKYRKVIKSLEEFNRKIFQELRVDFYHFRLYAYLYESQIENDLRSTVYDNFQTCFQDSGIIAKFKIYYAEGRSCFRTEEIPSTIKTIQNLIKTDSKTSIYFQASQKYKFNKQIVYEWLYYIRWLIDNEQEEVCSYYVSLRLKDYYTVASLENMDFPTIYDTNDFLSFYQTAYAIVKLYILLYRGDKPYKPKKQFDSNIQANETMGKRKGYLIISNFLEQLQNNYEVINFEGSDELKSVIIHFINYIKIQKYILSEKPEKAVEVCQQGVLLIHQANGITQFGQKIFILHYLSKLLSIVFAEKKLPKRQSYLAYTFRIIKKERLLDIVFDHHFGWKFLWFVNSFLLLSDQIDLFVKTHQKLLRIIEYNPKDESVGTYCQALEQVLDDFKDHIKANLPNLIDTILKHRIVQQKYILLLLSCLSKYISKENTFIFDKNHAFVALKVDQITAQGKRIVLNSLFERILDVCIYSEKGNFKKQLRKIKLCLMRYGKYILAEDKLQSMMKDAQKKEKQIKKFKKKKKNYSNILQRFQHKSKLWINQHFQYETVEESPPE